MNTYNQYIMSILSKVNTKSTILNGVTIHLNLQMTWEHNLFRTFVLDIRQSKTSTAQNNDGTYLKLTTDASL